MKNEKIQVLVTFPKTQNMSKRKAVAFVRSSVHGAAHRGETEEPFTSQATYATVREYKHPDSGVIMDQTEELRLRREAYSQLCIENSDLKKKIEELESQGVDGSIALRPDIVTVFTAINTAINSIDHSKHLPGAHQRREYYKAGARKTLKLIGEAIQQVANVVVQHGPEARDGDLFNYWVQEAAMRPSRLASALKDCTSPSEYRAVLSRLRAEDIQGVTSANKIVEEGGLIQG